MYEIFSIEKNIAIIEKEEKITYPSIIIHSTDIKGLVLFHEEHENLLTIKDATKAVSKSKTQNILELSLFSDEYN
ncbi:hypothetical protein ACE193_19710 [Bernardetia sp. OM2101]|uniref:hypothetical protein n=1 Tax=Bernardetia sp. OM2101 TaxID=3344876 RepID=UPI0035D0D104